MLTTLSLLLWVLAPTPGLTNVEQDFGTVKYLTGRVTSGNRALKVGDSLQKGELIQTADKSIVKILLRSNLGAIQLGPNSEFLAEESTNSQTTIQLKRGALLSTLRKAAIAEKKKSYEVKTPKVSMGVRGTTFFVSQNAEGSTYQCICEGEVETSWPGGKDRKRSKHHDHFRSFSSKDGRPTKDIGRDHTDEEIQSLKEFL